MADDERGRAVSNPIVPTSESILTQVVNVGVEVFSVVMSFLTCGRSTYTATYQAARTSAAPRLARPSPASSATTTSVTCSQQTGLHRVLPAAHRVPDRSEVPVPLSGPLLRAYVTSRPSTPRCDWWRLCVGQLGNGVGRCRR